MSKPEAKNTIISLSIAKESMGQSRGSSKQTDWSNPPCCSNAWVLSPLFQLSFFN
jgi:hypothetical protein